ncbi:MAG: YdcF family protein [Halobacteriovoraceae bacterium]|nr:YdcF family protein [Halobacteriovoraceae bacterium]
MFESKYVFETKRTKVKRYIKNSILSCFLAFVVYSIFSVIFVLYSHHQNKLSARHYFNRGPDLIVVFTGDKGRIPYAIKMAKEYQLSKIFITGVHNRNSVESLLTKLEIGENIDVSQLEIDYLARNTVENVLSTLRYIRSQTAMEEILIISHDYHILRIQTLIESIRSNDDPYKFFYSGVKTDYSQWRNIKILYKEFFKLIRATLFVFLWVDDVRPDDVNI